MTKTISLFLIVMCIATSLISCSSDETANSPISVDNEQLEEAFSQAGSLGNIKSLAVSHEGIIIKEEFFGTGGADVSHDVRSVTKSIIGLLVGIAIEKGFIQSIEELIGDYLSTLVDDIPTEKSNIKIGNLLTMSSGFEWEEIISVSGYSDWITSTNQVQYLLDRTLVSQPGQSFTYNSAALHLLSVILSIATNMQTLDFAQQYLFDPMEIGDRNWTVDRQGYNNGGAGLQITPHDMVKIGQLILDRGEYNGVRIVSSNWIDRSISTQIQTFNAMSFASGYGYTWWTDQSTRGNYVFANGYGGQFIVVVPNLNLVVVATNEWSGVGAAANEQWYRTMYIITTVVFSAFPEQ